MQMNSNNDKAFKKVQPHNWININSE